jgi:hypothetical protein
MIQRNDTQVMSRAKNRSRRTGSRARSRRPQMETVRYQKAPDRVAVFMDPPHDKPVYSIGELVTVAFERAALVANDSEMEALVATRLLAEWLMRARSTDPAAERPAQLTRAGRSAPQGRGRSPRRQARRSAFSSAAGWHVAA